VRGSHPAPITPSASQWPKPLRSPVYFVKSVFRV
jgi:hypothetical protein